MNSTGNFDNLIQDFDLNQFLTQNKHLDAASYLLRYKGNTNLLNWLLAEQLKTYPKAHYKLPHFAKHHCWFTSKSYEQASSESSAIFKSKRFSGEKMLDLSAGLGVDDWAFANKFKQIISLDPDEELNSLVRLNYQKLGIHNIQRLQTTAEDYLLNHSNAYFDLVYLDADRRPEAKRSWLLDLVQPNYLAMENTLANMAKQILLKVSPMVDLSYLQKSLRGVKEIWVLGDAKEVKEVLVLIEPNYAGSVQTEAIVMKEQEEYDSFIPSPTETEVLAEPTPSQYFFEPHPVILKAGFSKKYASYLGLNLIAPESAFYLGDHIPANFMGRPFQLIHSFEFSKNACKEYLQQKGIKQANITRRNFVLSTDELKKMLKLQDGGAHYLFFTSDASGKKLCFHAQKT